jgi:hypothetical protein
MKIFFNCLVYKDLDVVGELIVNIKKFVKDPVIVLHVAPAFYDFDFDRFSYIDNVYINPIRYDHGQWGTKIKALTSNHDLLKSKGIEFDYEVIFYPKMLFIKRGIEEYLDGIDLCMPSLTKEKKDLVEVSLGTGVDVFTEEEKSFFNYDIEKFLVEGMCFKKEISNKMYEMIKSTPLYNKSGHCYEESVLPTVAKYFAKTIKHYPGIISLWFLSIDNLKMIINREIDKFSSFFIDNQDIDNIYFVHKVDYGYYNDVRKLIREVK